MHGLFLLLSRCCTVGWSKAYVLCWLSCGLCHPVQGPAAPVQWNSSKNFDKTICSAEAQAGEREQDQQLHLENGCWSYRKPNCFILDSALLVITAKFLVSLWQIWGSVLLEVCPFQARTDMFKSVWLLRIPLHQFLFSMAILHSSGKAVLLFLLQILLNYFHLQVNRIIWQFYILYSF